MARTRPNTEDFHPMSANIYGPARTIRASGVPGQTTPTLLMNTRIKPPRGLYTSERMNNQQADSRSDTIIEVWALGVGANLTADMWIVHNGIRYDVIGRDDMGADHRSQTIKYQCRNCGNST